MRQLVVQLRTEGHETPEDIYRACAELQATGGVDVLGVVAAEDLRDRVEATCDAVGIG